jgi:hypothetical protein
VITLLSVCMSVYPLPMGLVGFSLAVFCQGSLGYMELLVGLNVSRN